MKLRLRVNRGSPISEKKPYKVSAHMLEEIDGWRWSLRMDDSGVLHRCTLSAPAAHLRPYDEWAAEGDPPPALWPHLEQLIIRYLLIPETYSIEVGI